MTHDTSSAPTPGAADLLDRLRIAADLLDTIAADRSVLDALPEADQKRRRRP
jgi:hypothetical protein